MKKGFLLISIGLGLALLTYGCGGTQMRPASPGAEASYKPAKNEATVIFMRPSAAAFAVKAPVYDVTTADNVLIGILSSKHKVAYKVTPGEHLFMVVGEAADFMRAMLEGGKTYYALVTPRIGAWKARFSLKPVTRPEIDSDAFNKWNGSCEFFENTDATLEWARNNAESVQRKREAYFQKWTAKGEEKQPELMRQDGI